MNNIFDFIKSGIVVITTTLSVLNPFNTNLPNTPSVEIPTSTSIRNYINTPSVTPQKQQAGNLPLQQTLQDANTQTSSNSISPNDSDPLVFCNSKTGSIRVKRSICSSYTDCPDGYGGYVFESQDACKQRWQKIGSDLKNVMEDYGKAVRENLNLQNQLNNNAYQKQLQENSDKYKAQADQILKDSEEEKKRFEEKLEKIRQEQLEFNKNLITPPTPTPTSHFSCPGGGCENFSY